MSFSVCTILFGSRGLVWHCNSLYSLLQTHDCMDVCLYGMLKFDDLLAKWCVWDWTGTSNINGWWNRSRQALKLREIPLPVYVSSIITDSFAVQQSVPVAAVSQSLSSRLPVVTKPARGGLPGSQFSLITEEEFSSVSSLVRGRVKLDEVNQVS